MIIFVFALCGAALGAWRAKSRGGAGPDIAQYAIAHAIAFGILGVFAGIAIDHFLVQ